MGSSFSREYTLEDEMLKYLEVCVKKGKKIPPTVKGDLLNSRLNLELLHKKALKKGNEEVIDIIEEACKDKYEHQMYQEICDESL